MRASPKSRRLLDLTPYLSRKAQRLTADAKQKISLGRGLVRSDVAAVLFDEPLTVIDPELKWQLRSKLKALHRDLDLTMIYVTHDQTEALTFADTVVVMHDGRVVQSGTPAELFDRPAHTFVGYFIGSPGMNIMPAEVNGRQAHISGHTIALNRSYDRLPAGAKIEVGVRPEFVEIASPAPNLLAANIERIDDLGRVRFAHVRVGDTRFSAKVPPGFSVSGNDAGLVFDPSRVHVYADSLLVEGAAVMDKTVNQKAWLLVLPVFLVVAFSAILPLMTVVNYSMQDTFGNNQFFWNGVGWFKELLDPSSDLGSRFFASLWRNLFFSAVDPGDRSAARHRRRAVDAAAGLERRRLPRDHGFTAAYSLERGRHHLADFWPSRHRPARLCAEPHRDQLQLRLE